MTELEKSFIDYIEEVKKLTLEEKRNELLDSIKELIATFQTIAENEGIELTKITNLEAKDLENGNETEEDYLEAAIEYIEVAKNSIGEYLDKKDI